MKQIKGSVTAPKGFLATGVRCGVKTAGRDLALIVTKEPASVAGTFTLNMVKAAPVLLSQKHVALGKAHAIIANAGNANACTGDQGMLDAQRMAEATARELGLRPETILVCSTGVIGHAMPMDQIERGIVDAAKMVTSDGGSFASEAIMTTDTRPKEIALEFEIEGVPVRIGGISKGSGMICPNMATMLAFITTDAAIESMLLQKALNNSVDKSFNCVTVDGDGSTNDTVLVLANGTSGAAAIAEGSKSYQTFCEALDTVCIYLAKEIAGDGEGATKRVTIHVEQVVDAEKARLIAKTIANSNLTKTAIFGNDPNWGRIMAAAGRSGAQFDPATTNLWLCGTQLVASGQPVAFDAASVSNAMKAKDVEIRLTLGEGSASATMWTCDFSYDYVRINAEYHT
jgi:glutamate N-acetyltransferase/amino-acid N-acetyltransferase